MKIYDQTDSSQFKESKATTSGSPFGDRISEN